MAPETDTTNSPALSPASDGTPQELLTTADAPPKPKGVVSLTPEALDEVNRLREKKGLDRMVLRVGVKGGGCAGLSYTMSFEDNEIKPTDIVLEYDGVTLIVDRKSSIFLRGMVLNYSDSLIGGGFKFENPNAKKSCSCGSSFSA
ncbi:MAG: iron-sulfur cluster assembly accessory protein [Armatimonadetes bacterium]|nr:iron-sulfur cluster assembly accessory protein [Armatimonadota bacterium]